MSVNTKYTDKPNDQYQRANLKGLVGYFHKRWARAKIIFEGHLIIDFQNFSRITK